MEAEEYALMDAVEDRMWWYAGLHAMVIRSLARHAAPAGLPLLDVGCGTGGLLRRLGVAMRDGRLSQRPLAGFDIVAEAVLRAHAKMPEARIVRASANEIPFAAGSIAAAVSCDVLCHRAVDEARALGELRRVLAPGGLVVLNMPAHAWLVSAHDRRVHTRERYSRGLLRARLAAAGFRPLEVLHWNSLLFPLMVVQRKLLTRSGEGDAAPQDRSDVAAFPPPIEAMFRGVTAVERAMIGAGVRFPAGGSVLAVAVKP
jgi:ubiquinone/menaquinone biosynthesis C-methylase UbiE